MPKPSVEPTSICVRAELGESRSVDLTIAKAPTAANVTASITNGNSLITLKDVIAIQHVHRDFTEEEIQELPPFPKSIRENARKNGYTADEEVGRTDGSTPLAVSAGQKVQFDLEFSAPQQQPPDFIAASLVIEGTTWESVEVPLGFMMAQATFLPAVAPANIQLAAEPGETVTQDLVITQVLADAKVVAHVENGGSTIRLKNLIVFRPVKLTFTEDEIEQLPPALRENARKNGYMGSEEVARTSDCVALAASKGFMVRIYIECVPPDQRDPDFLSATLNIEGSTWQHIEVPISLVIGKVVTVPSANAITVRQGESGDLNLQVSSVAGPGTDVEYGLGMGADQWSIVPAVIHLARGETVSAAVKVVVAPKAPPGTYPVGLEVRSFDRLEFLQIPFELTVLPSLVFVKLLQPSQTALQGDRITYDVEIRSLGGYKHMVFSPGTLPNGVTISGPSAYIGPDSVTTVMKLDCSVDPQARPIADAHATIFWTAEDTANTGMLTLSLTVLLRPESKSFSQQILTPAGTALGGTAAMILNNDGSNIFQGSMHDSGFPSYKFRVRAAVRSASGKVVVLGQASGGVEGSEVELLFRTPQRDFAWSEQDTSQDTMQAIRDQWPDIRSGAMTVNKSYELAGALGTLEDLAKDVLGFLIADVMFGPQLALVIAVGHELSSLAGASFVGPGGLVGVVVAGGIVWLMGPGMVGGAVAAGVLAGAVTDELIRNRPISQSEMAFASKVFGDTLPPAERIILTNLSNGNRAFTWPNIDGTILVNIGIQNEGSTFNAFENPMGYSDRNYPKPGQLLIHELTHAWQMHNSKFLPGFICEGAGTGGIHYNYGPPFLKAGMALPPWGSTYGIEQQAAIVDNWFGGSRLDSSQMPMDKDDPYFGYILNNIRLGQP